MAPRTFRGLVSPLLFSSGAPRTFGALVAIALSAQSIRPVGLHGAGPWVLGLFVLSAALLVLRLFSRSMLGNRSETGLFLLAIAASFVLMGIDRSGSSAVFAYFLAGQIGYRRENHIAIGYAILIGAGCAIAILVGHGVNHIDTPWWVGLLSGAPVVAGIASRNRELALDAAHEAARQAEAASKSAARAEAMAERARIARDVHDVLAHSLAGINLQLEAVDALLEVGETIRAREATGRAQSLVREGLAEVSRTVQAMRADALPLVATMNSLVDSAAPSGTSLAVTGEERELPTPASTALLRCAQEALTNARKYAPGAAVTVALAFSATAVDLAVRNGRPPASARPLASGSGMGLVGMRERVLGVGGTLQTGPIVEGPQAGGWQVHVTVPVAR